MASKWIWRTVKRSLGILFQVGISALLLITFLSLTGALIIAANALLEPLDLVPDFLKIPPPFFELKLGGEHIPSLLSTISIGAGILIAILTFIRDRFRIQRERIEAESKVLLQISSSGMDEVIELLRDRNNNRITWIQAARVLLKSLSLGETIKAPEYRAAYRAYAERTRSELYRILSLYDATTGLRKPLPPQFFYGIENWDEDMSLDDATIEASKNSGFTASEVKIDHNLPVTGLKEIDPKSVIAIYDFLKFPTDYDDPLQDVEPWKEDWADSYGHDQGAQRYVAHKKGTSAHRGVLYKNEP